MERQDKEQQNEGHENEEQQNEVECCEIEDDLLFYGLLEDHGIITQGIPFLFLSVKFLTYT